MTPFRTKNVTDGPKRSKHKLGKEGGKQGKYNGTFNRISAVFKSTETRGLQRETGEETNKQIRQAVLWIDCPPDAPIKSPDKRSNGRKTHGS